MKQYLALCVSGLILLCCVAVGTNTASKNINLLESDTAPAAKIQKPQLQPENNSDYLQTLCFISPEYKPCFSRNATPTLNKQEIESTLNFLKKHFPISYNHATMLKAKSPKKFNRYVFVAYQKIAQLNGLPEDRRKTQLEFAKVNIEIFVVTQKFRAEKDQKKKKTLNAKLKNLLARHMELEQKITKFQIQDLESHKKVLLKKIEKRDQNKDRILQSRLKLLELGKIRNPRALGNPIPSSDLELVTTPKPAN